MTTHELALWAIKGMLMNAGDAPSPHTAKRIAEIVDEALGVSEQDPDRGFITEMERWAKQ